MKYNKTTNEEILYKNEWVNIPFINDFSFCNYTYILFERLVSLGLDNNILKKESDNIYTYYGEPPSIDASDLIRYTPQKGYWKADKEIYLKYPQNFSYVVYFLYSRYYRRENLTMLFIEYILL